MPGAMSGHPFLYDMYIMNRILIIILLLTCTVSHAQPPETVQHLGSTITTYGRKIISDKGSIWLTGEFNGELITDTQTDLTSALPTVFVARYSVEGIREHLSMIENESQVRSAATDENGTLWLLTGTDGNEKLHSISPEGVLSVPVSLTEHTDLILKDFVLLDHTLYLCGNSGEQYFLAAYSMSGEQLWKISESEYASASAEKIATDGTDIILAGTCRGTMTGDTNLFASRFNTSGKKLWTCPIIGTGNESLSDMACMNNGKIALSGSTTSKELTIGSSVQATTSAGVQHALCILLNPDGSYSSIYTAGGTSTSKNTMINALYINDNDEIYAGGYCTGKVVFNPSGDNRYNLPDKGAKDAFLIKLSPENRVLNVKRFGNKTEEEITDLLFMPDADETRLFILTNFKEADEYGITYHTTNLTLSGTTAFPLDATGTGNNIALTSYPHIRIFTDHVIPAQEDIAYRNCIYHRGGSRKVTYQLLSGNLPAGISLSVQGDLSGIPLENGSFPLTIQGTDELGDTSVSSCTLQIASNGGTGFTKAEESNLQIYPNPVENEFFIEGITGAPQIRLQIISAQGQLMQDRKLTSLSEAINVSDLPQGIYIIRCISEQNIRSQKIIKK